MYTVRYGGKEGPPVALEVSERHVAVRTARRTELDRTPLDAASRRALDPFRAVARFDEAGVEVLCTDAAQPEPLRDQAREALKADPAVQFAGRVLRDPASGEPVVYTENLFVKLRDGEPAAAREALLEKYGLQLRRHLKYARNAFFVSLPEGTGLETFGVASALLDEPAVELCHPELVRRLGRRRAFAPQWHLKRTRINKQVINAHANVSAAWRLSKGKGVVIAVIDDGVDVDHEEFSSAGKIVHPRDVSLKRDDPRPTSGRHGTACAGVACAGGRFGASGVAPMAKLMPIRSVSALGSQAEADAFVWAADHGADVISCSWGPVDGAWWDPNDPTHDLVAPLPDSTRLAIDYAVRTGRKGKGCVILFAAGNGNEPVDRDGYASYEKVTAVAACNDSGLRSVYSDTGAAVWCAFPSGDFGAHVLTPGIWTTDRSGPAGYNPGQTARGDAAGNYTNSFSGTSSACPGAAGVVALLLARNPELRWDDVKVLLAKACDQVDAANGQYDEGGHSPLYGYGRLNAKTAVKLAIAAAAAAAPKTAVARPRRTATKAAKAEKAAPPQRAPKRRPAA